MDYQAFFESAVGQIALVGAVILLLALIFFLSPKREKMNAKALSLAAVLIALAFVVNNFLPRYKMPQGGSVTLFSMFFLFLVGYVLGPKIGVLAGMAYGILDLIMSPSAYYPMQILMDYPLAFGMLGVGALLRNQKHGLYTGYLLGIFGRFLISFLSGLIFFGEYAPEGYTGFTWSLWYNLTYIGVEGALTLVVLAIPPVRKAVQQLTKQYRQA